MSICILSTYYFVVAQGRLPIRVHLQGLTEGDLYRILTEPEPNLIRQQKELLKTENIDLEFTDGAIREIARVAAEVRVSAPTVNLCVSPVRIQVNRAVENIGARRLHTVIERIVEEVSGARGA
jgi:ATP-dependent HslUV protease ATP-binding subunit HslU